MHIKRYEAPTLLEAIQQVKSELGPHALVISQRTLRRGRRWLGLGARSVVEVVAAVDRDTRRGDAPGPVDRPPVAPVEREGPADPSWKLLPITKALVDPLESELRSQRRLLESLSLSLAERADLAADVETIHRAARDLQRSAGLHEEGRPDLVAPLLHAGLSPGHAYRIAERAEAHGGERAGAVQASLVAALDRRMRPPRPDRASRVEIFVGPTGVGKTTTLAKVAARSVEQGDALSLLTTDVERIGADASLRGFAEGIGVRLECASSAADLSRGLDRHGGRLLVDTGGRSPADSEALPELLGLRDELGSRARVHLVLSATTKEEDLRSELRRFRPLSPDGLVFTKLDESRRVGNVANVILDPDSPDLVWFADGQRVPADLRLPDPDDFAKRVLESIT